MQKFIARISSVAVLALAALPAIGVAQAAHAASPLARIPVGDLNLARPDDARIFKARIDAAGEAVCDARTQSEKLGALSARACRLDVRDEVRSKLTRAQARALRSVGG